MSAKSTDGYPSVPTQANYPAIEERVLARWKAKEIFQRSVEERPAGVKGANEYVFYDGPPFANGLPHYGHLLTGYVKDIIPRYHTMLGRKVDRRFGWDCHGLPPEMEAEKELKISGRKAIEAYGIAKFNDYCRTSVQRYTKEWESYVSRQARWVDFSNDYKTMDLSYMESVMWAFKELWKKGLIYEGHRVLPYSWACETPLSNFETRLDNAYRPRQDPAVTVIFELEPKRGDKGTMKVLAWTTTPWTLPSNLALAVGKDIEYAVMAEGSNHYIIADAAREKYEAQLKSAKKIAAIRGADLVGRKFTPLFPYFSATPNAFRILAGEFVSTEEGTGVVHMAPGFGEDDQLLCEANGIPIVCPVDATGKFTEEVKDYVGMHVFDANKPIIQHLKERKLIVKHETYEHNYPHCWRTDTPIIYRALSSWYVRVTDFRDRMVALNKQIRWIPEHVRDGQFGKWLENARDWSISRNRFWGSPIPVWRSDDPKYPRIDVYGSLDELERDFGVRPKDLHRPYIDELVRPNPDDPTGKSMMRRVEDVLDCWFESGSMPFAQVHYPFENKEWFEEHFPADFIVEYIAQTRGWFYTLVVLATALFDKPPFMNCMCHGVVLDENGQKLSKRLKNYPSPEEVWSTYGADALRWFLCASGILRGSDLQIDREGKAIGETVRTVLNPLWSAYAFFTMYANADGIRGEFRADSTQLLDRYILSKTRELVLSVTEALNNYDIPGACQLVTAYVDALNNWYIRRSRERFWRSGEDADKRAGYNTLYTVLVTVTKLCAPLLPLVTEEIFTSLTGAESIHLEDWPTAEGFPADSALVSRMDRVRDVCASGLSIREAHRLRTRLPLSRVTVAGVRAEELKPYAAFVQDELNVKEVSFTTATQGLADLRLQVDARKLGPRLGGKVKDVLAAARAGKWEQQKDGTLAVGGEVLNAEEFTLALMPIDEKRGRTTRVRDEVVIIDTTVTPELEAEGLARDAIRFIQQTRKEANLNIADRIALSIEADSAVSDVLKAFQTTIAAETLAKQVSFAAPPASSFIREGALGEGQSVRVGVERVG